MAEFYHSKSISEVHQLLGLGKPVHPLITIIREWPKVEFDLRNIKLTSDLYLFSMKGKVNGTFRYGRNSYDFQEGALVFIAPNQVVSFEDPMEHENSSGWTILFHPDLIRNSALGSTIKRYAFLDYDVTEALHLSEKEQVSLNDLVEKIETEIHQNLDRHSQDLIVQNLETILKYSNRYYERQFYTRTNLNVDLVQRFEKFLETYFASDELLEKGIPTLKQCGEALNLSGPYLSDLLRISTGSSAKEHIHRHIIASAKVTLLRSNISVAEVAYKLGFEYPQHFSKLFKSQTGMSPSEYRNLN
jgi:AraC-like DNA-binding protein